MTKTKVVILGGGFAGLYAAMYLDKKLARRPDVARIEGNPQVQNVIPQPVAPVESPSQPKTPQTIEPGINYTHAPDVWALGFRGQGITVAGADTGRLCDHRLRCRPELGTGPARRGDTDPAPWPRWAIWTATRRPTRWAGRWAWVRTWS